MSARLLRKTLQEYEQNHIARTFQQPDEGQGDDDTSPEAVSSVPINPFDLLNDNESVQEEDAGEDIADGNFHGEKSDCASLEDDVQTVPAVSKKVGKKKKKKKQRGGATSSSAIQNSGEIEDEVEKLSLGVLAPEQQEIPCSANLENASRSNQENIVSSILKTDPKSLNPENELIRIFGSKVVKSSDKIGQTSNSRHSRSGRRRYQYTRKTVLVSSMDHWPQWDGSLSMEFLETKNGYHYFRYIPSSSYEQAQRAFEATKTLHNINEIASILMHHPYHVESLLTRADYFQFVGEHQMSSDAISKCLYALECGWNPLFTPLQGNCQLKICHETNVSFFKVMFTHMKNLDRRGCHRSALEVCKLLLSLDDDDPMGTLFCLDYFALRAQEYDWLERFSWLYPTDNSLWLFPNFTYSLAICRFYLEQKEFSNNDSATAKASSSELMKQALMLHPYVLKRLVAKVPLKEKSWTDILMHKFFRSENNGAPSLDHLVKLYVERSYILWRLPELQKFLRDSAFKIIDLLQNDSSAAINWICARKDAFSSENNEYSHLLVSDFSDTIPTLPPENLHDFMVDPNIRQMNQGGNEINNAILGEPALRDIQNRNQLAVLFESILPWVHYGQGQNNEVNEDNHEEHQDN